VRGLSYVLPNFTARFPCRETVVPFSRRWEIRGDKEQSSPILGFVLDYRQVASLRNQRIGLDWARFNVPLDTFWVISETVGRLRHQPGL